MFALDRNARPSASRPSSPNLALKPGLKASPPNPINLLRAMEGRALGAEPRGLADTGAARLAPALSGGDLLARRVFGNTTAPPSPQVQRKCEKCEEEEQKVGRKAEPGVATGRAVQREVKPEDEEQTC